MFWCHLLLCVFSTTQQIRKVWPLLHPCNENLLWIIKHSLQIKTLCLFSSTEKVLNSMMTSSMTLSPVLGWFSPETKQNTTTATLHNLTFFFHAKYRKKERQTLIVQQLPDWFMEIIFSFVFITTHPYSHKREKQNIFNIARHQH